MPERRRAFWHACSTAPLLMWRPGIPVVPERPGRLRTIDDFRCDPVYAGDGDRIDLAYSVYALADGVDETAVRRAIESRDLSKKGSDARQRRMSQGQSQKHFSASANVEVDSDEPLAFLVRPG